MRRVLILMATRTYRARAFMRAARRRDLDVVVGSERRQALSRARPGSTVVVSHRQPERAVEQIAEFARTYPLDAVLGVDDDTTLVAALAAERLGLRHNAPAAVHATRDKALMRRLLSEQGVPSPWFEVVPLTADLPAVAARLSYPCVVKPTFLSASRGVIRADDPGAFLAAVERIRPILAEPEVAAAGGEAAGVVLVEGFIPGVEVALEGMLAGGELRVLALFDKPDPLDGPFFEETVYVTPSRLPEDVQRDIAATTARAAAGLGLREGPVHAEARINPDGVWLVEIAARSIGGLCSDTLEFSGGRSLEELILMHAAGEDLGAIERRPEPSGVMMIPIARAGRLDGVTGVEAARAVPGIVDVTISVPVGDTLVPLPEGNRYLGFIFARAATPERVEAALREAHDRLEFTVTPPAAAAVPAFAG
jgi:biotin carboxylase